MTFDDLNALDPEPETPLASAIDRTSERAGERPSASATRTRTSSSESSSA